MYPRILQRCLALLGTSAVLAALGIPVAAPAQADPVCVGATVSGTATGSEPGKVTGSSAPRCHWRRTTRSGRAAPDGRRPSQRSRPAHCCQPRHCYW